MPQGSASSSSPSDSSNHGLHTVGVVGAGTMGAGIAQVLAQSGIHVVLYDVGDALLDRATQTIAASLERAVSRGKISQEVVDRVETCLTTTTDINTVAQVELVIEAVPEDMDLKIQIFTNLDRLAMDNTVLVTNTSSLSVTTLAASTERPDRVAGLHFFNPVPAMKLVEIIQGAQTDPQVVQRLTALVQALGKSPVVAQDTPGFIVNRVARPFYGEALRLLSEGATSVDAIDGIIQHGGRFRMGPFTLMDLIGIDVNYAVTQSVYEASFHEPRYRPSRLQAQKVAAGHLGQKSGQGFYAYAEGKAVAETSQDWTTVDPTQAEANLPQELCVCVWGERREQSRGAQNPSGALGASLYGRTLGLATQWNKRLNEAGIEASAVSSLAKASCTKASGRSVWMMGDGPDPSRWPLLAEDLHSAVGDSLVLVNVLDQPATTIARWFPRPENVIGFSPVGLLLHPSEAQPIVELVPSQGARCNDQAMAVAVNLFQAMGCCPVVLEADTPGLVLGRVWAALVNEAASTLMDGVATPQDIDTAMKRGTNYPHGPLEWAESVGIDVALRLLTNLYEDTGEERYRPMALLKRLVMAGHIGQPSGSGFYPRQQADGSVLLF